MGHFFDFRKQKPGHETRYRQTFISWRYHQTQRCVLISVVKYRVSDRKVADLRQYVVLSLGKTLFANFLVEQSNLPVLVAPPDKRLANRAPTKGCSALVWSDRRRVLGSYERISSLRFSRFCVINC